MNDDRPSRPCFRETIEVDLSDYIDLKIKPLNEKYEKSEKLLAETRSQFEKQNDAYFANKEDSDRKLGDAMRQFYASLATLILLVFAVFIAHLLGKV